VLARQRASEAPAHAGIAEVVDDAAEQIAIRAWQVPHR
jgi:hypothetical protein